MIFKQFFKKTRGTKGFIYPWGNNFDKSKCKSAESVFDKTIPVGTYPSGKSPYGCMDMAGNVWEWCSDWYAGDYYKNSPVKNPQGPSKGACRSLRGGSWVNRSGGLRCAARYGVNPWSLWLIGGFRIVLLFASGHTL